MKQKLLLALCVIGMMASAQGPSGFPDININSNTTWSSTYMYANKIVVKSPNTLVIKSSSTVYMDLTGSIEVESGASLIVENSTITGIRSRIMWNGITTCHNSVVSITKGSHIKHARCAISTIQNNNMNTTGGTITLKDSFFENCCKSVDFMIYNDNCIIENVSFIIDNNNLFSASSTSFDAHITGYNSVMPVIKGCEFANDSNNAPYGDGIRTINSSFIVNNLYSNVILPNGEQETLSASVFRGFDRGINNLGSTSGRSFSVLNASFSGNITGIYASGIYNPTIENNYIKILDDDYVGLFRYGIYLTSCTGYSIEENVISGQSDNTASVGIDIHDGGTANNIVRKNSMDSLYYGGYAEGTNGSNSLLTGLQFQCCDFINTGFGILGHYQTTFRPTWGTSSRATGNAFAYCNYDLHLNSPYTVTYYYNGTVPSTDATVSPVSSGQPFQCISVSPFSNTNVNPIEQYLLLNNSLSSDISFDSIIDVLSNMSDIKDRELRNLYADTDNNQLENIMQWFEVSNTLSDKYALVEINYLMGLFDEAISILNTIPVQYDLDSIEGLEYESYFDLLSLVVEMDDNDRRWTNMNQSEENTLMDIAENGYGRASDLAKGVLCFMKIKCYEEKVPFAVISLQEIDEENESQSSAHHQPKHNLYPNPTSSNLVISWNESFNLCVYDLSGVMIERYTDVKGNISIDVSSWKEGMYYYLIENESAKEYGKFIVTKK